jgi:uncharacterized membrane protein
MAIPRIPHPPRRVLRARRSVRAGVVQILGAVIGLGLGLLLPRLDVGPTVSSGRMAELLFTLGLGTLGLVTLVFSLLFGVVQWTASSFGPRLNLFRDDPLVWRSFGFAVGVFVFGVTSGLTAGARGHVSLVLPVTAVLAVLAAAYLVRVLQTRAFESMQLARVLRELTTRGHAAIDYCYPPDAPVSAQKESSSVASTRRRTVTWAGQFAMVQQFDVHRLIGAATAADTLVVFRVRVGETLHAGSPLADLQGGELSDQVVHQAVVAGNDRTLVQDPLFAFRLLADIALRALSPALNDPATAVDVIDAVEDLLRTLGGRDLRTTPFTDADGVPRVLVALPGWEDFLRTGVEDLLPPAAASSMVRERLLVMLDDLVEATPPQRHAALTRLRQRTIAGAAM